MEINVLSNNFEQEVIKSDKPVLVDFWAPWCGPCKMISPLIKNIAEKFQDNLKVCKVNVDESSDIATKYTVMSIPALMIFKDGQIMEKRVGAMGKEDLEKFVQPYLAGKSC